MGTTMKVKGISELKDELEIIKNKINSVSGTHEIKITELLTSQFMKEHSEYDSFETLARASGLCNGDGPITKEEFASIPDSEWDAWIQKSTDFKDWKSMMSDAGRQYIIKRINL